MNDIIELLERLEDYMENKSDSIDLETGGIAPNEEMGLQQEIAAAIEKLRGKHRDLLKTHLNQKNQ